MDNNDSLLTQSEATVDNTEVSTHTEVEEQAPSTPTPKRRIARSKPKEGPRRHMKRVKNSLASIRKPSIKRLGRKAGIKRFTSGFYDQARKELSNQLHVFLKECQAVTEMNRKKTVNNECVRYVFQRMGRPLYISRK